MLLAIDIGNTNIVIGIFYGKRLIKDWRISTDKTGSSNEYGITLINLLKHAGIDPDAISGAIISCVVPSIQQVFFKTLKDYIEIKPLIVDSTIETSISILYDNPEEVGADRIVNAAAAFERYKNGIIVVDFGTATTFDYISSKGEYVGGAIAPGIMVSLGALSCSASMLPRVEFLKPERVIGKNTAASIQSGTFYGYVNLVDGMIGQIQKEVKGRPVVIATGGLAPLISPESKRIDKVEKNLTLEGLKIIYDMNQTA